MFLMLTDWTGDSGALSRHEVTASFSQQKTVNSTNYLDVLDLFSVQQMAALQRNVFIQHVYNGSLQSDSL
jgi:hypothetical protein